MTDPTRVPRGRPDDDLRALLSHAVDDVEPTPALDHIRDRTKATTMSDKRPWLYGFLGAAVATAATVVGGDRAERRRHHPGRSIGRRDALVGPCRAVHGCRAVDAEPSESPEPSRGPPDAAGVETGPARLLRRAHTGRVGLVREFHDAEVGGGDLLCRDGQLGGGRSRWTRTTSPCGRASARPWARRSPAGPWSSAWTVKPGRAPAPSFSAEEARLAVQQLVYTATAALQRDVTVEFAINGRPAEHPARCRRRRAGSAAAARPRPLRRCG